MFRGPDWEIVPDRLATFTPSRYRVWLLPLAASTTLCQFPSLTALLVEIGSALPFQNSAFSLPSVPMYSAGV